VRKNPNEQIDQSAVHRNNALIWQPHGTSPSKVMLVWKLVVDRFRAAGARNVKWV
jgi:hypothetical protein